MRRKKPTSNDLLLTEAHTVPPPHDVTVPEPPTSEHDAVAGQVDPEILRDLRRLAERVGGLEKLKQMVDILIRFPR